MQRVLVYVPSEELRGGEAVTVRQAPAASATESGAAIARCVPVDLGRDEHFPAGSGQGPSQQGASGLETPPARVWSEPLEFGLYRFGAQPLDRDTGAAGSGTPASVVVLVNASPRQPGRITSDEFLSGATLRFTVEA